jgi:hypothetical protein
MEMRVDSVSGRYRLEHPFRKPQYHVGRNVHVEEVTAYEANDC